MKHKEIIEKWGTPAELSKDLGLGYQQVYGWFRRNSIPTGYWERVVTAATLRGIDGVDFNALWSGKK